MASKEQLINQEYAHMLAKLIRDNLDDLIKENIKRYDRDYAHSININLDEQTRYRWTEQELLSIAAQLEAGEVDPYQYEGMRGDIVQQNEELLYPIAGFLEMTFYIARMIADMIWEKYLGDSKTLNALFNTLEKFVQLRARENINSFVEQISEPHALIRSWRVGRKLATMANTEAPASDIAMATDVQHSLSDSGNNSDIKNSKKDLTGSSVLSLLTEREMQMALLVAEGKSNNEIASALSLQISTVRNTLSRIYTKLGIASRSELIVALARGN